jgi:hypothetical protein
MASERREVFQPPRTQGEFLWFCRTAAKRSHRHLLFLHSVMHDYRPLVRNINHLKLTLNEFLDTCNKSVPVYILRRPRVRLLRTVLYNYIHRQWFCPYRSEIDYQRFICKFITPEDLPNDTTTPTPSTINTIVSLNRPIGAGVEALHPTYDEKLASRERREVVWNTAQLEDHRLYVLRLLFQALLIVISIQNYRLENSKAIGRLPIFLVRTGIEDGLSAPITFEPIREKSQVESDLGDTRLAIRTTLETAIDS